MAARADLDCGALMAAAEAGHEDVVAVLSEAGAPLRPRTACARRTETDDALGSKCGLRTLFRPSPPRRAATKKVQASARKALAIVKLQNPTMTMISNHPTR